MTTHEVTVLGAKPIFEPPVDMAIPEVQKLLNALKELGFSDFKHAFSGYLIGANESRFSLSLDMKMPYTERKGENVIDLRDAVTARNVATH